LRHLTRRKLFLSAFAVKTYCNYTPRCVRCGEHHDSNECIKDRNTPVRCVLCSGNHPASYKDCHSHQELQKTKNNKPIVENYWTKNKHTSQNTQQSTLANSNTSSINNLPKLNKNSENSVTTNSYPYNQSNNEPNFNTHLSSFISDLKALINPLILLLTLVIDKLI